MSNDTDCPRGDPLNGPRAIAKHLWGDERRWRSVYLLPRETYRIIELPGGLVGYTGWLDAGLARNAGSSARRRRSKRAASADAAAAE